jgi:ABC-2 type transport system ATP-binding protein
MSSETPAILAHNLTKHFGDFTAVSGISFEVGYGEIFGFLGPNGSGKTTTIRMMLGLLPPSEGMVEVLGLQVDRNISRIRPRVGYMAQRFSLYNDLSVLHNLQFYGKAYGLSNEQLAERIKDALAMSGLEGKESSRTGDLSGGWRQRLALSAAILHQPEVLFLDEPTAGVDPLSRRAFWELLYELVAQGVTVFVTTHYMDEAEHCHRLGFIQRGELIALGSFDEIKRDVMPQKVLEIEPSDTTQAVKVLRIAAKENRLPLEDIELYGTRVHIFAPEIQKQKQAITAELRQAGIDPGHLEIIEPSLEDVFIASMR